MGFNILKTIINGQKYLNINFQYVEMDSVQTFGVLFLKIYPLRKSMFGLLFGKMQ